MKTNQRVAGNSASKSTPKRQPRSAATKKKNVLNSMFLQAKLENGGRLGVDMPLWADHEIEARYIADIAKDISKAQSVPMAMFYNDTSRKVGTAGSAAGHSLIDSDGNAIELTDEMYQQMVKDAEAQEMGEAPAVYKRKGVKRKDYDEQYGVVLGWVNWFFIQKDQNGSYRLIPAPRGTALRAKLPGHWDLHKDLRVFHGYGRLFRGRAVWMDPTKNDHIETKAGYDSNVFGG